MGCVCFCVSDVSRCEIEACACRQGNGPGRPQGEEGAAGRVRQLVCPGSVSRPSRAGNGLRELYGLVEERLFCCFAGNCGRLLAGTCSGQAIHGMEQLGTVIEEFLARIDRAAQGALQRFPGPAPAVDPGAREQGLVRKGADGKEGLGAGFLGKVRGIPVRLVQEGGHVLADDLVVRVLQGLRVAEQGGKGKNRQVGMKESHQPSSTMKQASRSAGASSQLRARPPCSRTFCQSAASACRRA